MRMYVCMHAKKRNCKIRKKFLHKNFLNNRNLTLIIGIVFHATWFYYIYCNFSCMLCMCVCYTHTHTHTHTHRFSYRGLPLYPVSALYLMLSKCVRLGKPTRHVYFHHHHCTRRYQSHNHSPQSNCNYDRNFRIMIVTFELVCAYQKSCHWKFGPR